MLTVWSFFFIGAIVFEQVAKLSDIILNAFLMGLSAAVGNHGVAGQIGATNLSDII